MGLVWLCYRPSDLVRDRSQTPLPFIFAVHLKQCVSIYLFVLPFTLVDIMGWRMVPLVAVVACKCRMQPVRNLLAQIYSYSPVTLMGVEGIASEVEQPFGEWVGGAVVAVRKLTMTTTGHSATPSELSWHVAASSMSDISLPVTST